VSIYEITHTLHRDWINRSRVPGAIREDQG